MNPISLSRIVIGIGSLCCTLAVSADHQQGPHGHPAKAAYSSVEPKVQSQAVAIEITAAPALTQPLQVCTPDADEEKPALRSDCITVLEDMSKRKGRYAATSRDKRELRSLCENQWLPRCRHKY